MNSFVATTATSLLVVALSGCSLMSFRPDSPQVAPGTSSRPVLSAREAAHFTPNRYFAQSGSLAAPVADPWKPAKVESPRKADFVVGMGGTHATIQQAVNAAITSGKTTRQYIKILPGTYTGAVYVPITAAPITLYGAGKKPQDVNVELKLDARVLPAVYAATVNPADQFKAGDPAWAMYNACATQPAAKVIDTPCSAVMWAQNDGFQLKNLTVTNTLLDTVDGETHQAVALRTDGDKTQLENVRIIGRQDSLLVNVGEAPTIANKLGTYPTDRIARAYIKDSYVEGDIDFVFGRANAVFDNCEFRLVSTRRKNQGGIVFAPDTVPASSLGFLVINSKITGDNGFQGTGRGKIGRSWDQGASGTGYLPGKSPNGQIVIRDSFIDSSFDLSKPWSQAATTNRPHTGNSRVDRDVDDPAYNRLWEYNNYGPGAGANLK
jgi:pectinesterase